MLLRRITKHVRDQNWFAVFLDFLIVVVGILIAFQITNWSEGRSNNQLTNDYYQRLVADINTSISELNKQELVATTGIEKIDAFTLALNDPDTSDADLVAITNDFFTDGLRLTGFYTTSATFDDLSATGNLGLISNPVLRNALINLHTGYKNKQEDSLVNTDWLLPFEASLIEQFDWLRYDEITAHHFPHKTDQQLAAEIRAAQDILRRKAAHHYWYHQSMMYGYKKTIIEARDVLKVIEAELGAQ